jgi:hypothetical protein
MEGKGWEKIGPKNKGQQAENLTVGKSWLM